MMGWLLLLAAGAADYGASPLVQPGHAHRWVEAQNDEELTGWIDMAWRGDTVIDGVRYKQLLLRTEDKENNLVADIIGVVDCAKVRMGMQRARVISPDVGDAADLPIGELLIEPLNVADDPSDRQLFEAACGTH
ncbi:hypothetical protein [Erythrobacter oryzae]|uniref:hypothetical protein n=1 Tax=Erythrobacter oryzae TaxID=3019556 RepID=UPI0025569363|nr:hypothetical protein [Erythrobacter sp. COR-2]